MRLYSTLEPLVIPVSVVKLIFEIHSIETLCTDLESERYP